MRKTTRRDTRVFLDDGTYLVTASLLSTPRRFYPIANTTARVRRDPLWLALGLTGFSSLATAIYGDLLYTGELAVLWGGTAALLAAGFTTAILHIDAVGHRNVLVFGTARKVRRLYGAIRDARMHASDAVLAVSEAQDDGE